MTVDEQAKVKRLTEKLFPAKVETMKKRGTLGAAQFMQLQWSVYNALMEEQLI